MNWGKVTAVLGGTFDPPHLGHREAAEGLLQNPGVKRVVIVPSGIPPLKANSTSSEHRVKMVRLNFPLEMEIETFEVEKAIKDPGKPTYTFETLHYLKQKFGEIAFVVGAEQLQNFHKWHRFPEILEVCNWIVLERKPVTQEQTRQLFEEWKQVGILEEMPSLNQILRFQTRGNKSILIHTRTPARQVSSTQIREEIAKYGELKENVMTPEVINYLKHHALYGI